MRHHVTIEMPAHISIGEGDDYNARITGTYLPAIPAYTPRGEYAPIDPPEPAAFEIDRIEISCADRDEWFPFPLGLITDEQAAEIERYCLDHMDYQTGPDPDARYDAKRDAEELERFVSGEE